MEDVLVRVDNFLFFVYFVILDIEEEDEVPLILERPFLAIRIVLVDVEQGKHMLRFQ